MTAHDRPRLRLTIVIAWASSALSMGCAQDPSATSASGMFSLPGTIELRETDEPEPALEVSSDEDASQDERLAAAIADNLRRGRQEAIGGRPDHAARFYERVLRDDPSNVEAHRRLAALADQSGDVYAAERSYLAALELDPDNPDLLSDLGEFYLSQQRFDEADRFLRQALDIESSHRRAMVHLGRLSRRNDALQRPKAIALASGLSDDLRRSTAHRSSVSPPSKDSIRSESAATPADSLPMWMPSGRPASAGRPPNRSVGS